MGPIGGWVVVPVLGHVLKPVPEYALKHVPKHVLRHMADKHVLKYCTRCFDNLAEAHYRLAEACSDDLAAAHYRLAHTVLMVCLWPTIEPNHIFY